MKQRLVILLFLLASVAWILPAFVHAETIYGKNYQLEVKTQFDGFSKELKQFLDEADQTYQDFFAKIGLERVRNSEVKVIALPTKEEFMAQVSARKFAPGFTPGAFYSRSQQSAYVYNTQDPRLYLSNLLHELSHHFILDFVPTGHEPPVCLNEGLAEVASSSPIRGTSIAFSPQIQLHSGRRVSLRAENGTLIPIGTLLGMNVNTFQVMSGQTDSYPYSQCWAFSQFLVNSDGGKFRSVLVALLTSKKPKTTYREIVEKALPSDVTLTEFEKAWETFAKNPR